MCSHQLGKSKLFCKLFLEDGIGWGPPEEEAVSVSCAAATWSLFREAVSLAVLHLAVSGSPCPLHVLLASPKETELTLK